MAKQVQLPDGSIGEFPDDMGDDQIKAVLDKQFGTDEIRSRRASGEQPLQEAAPNPLGGEGADTPSDGTLPKSIGGVELDDDMRQAILQGRELTDPQERRMLAASIAGRLDARKNGSEGEASALGLGTGIFWGALDYVGAAKASFDTDMSFTEGLAARKAYRHALEEEFPLASLGGEAIGTIVSGRAALKGAALAINTAKGFVKGKKAVSVVSKIDKGFKKATVFDKGAKLTKANVARGSGMGALAGGAVEGGSEGELAQGALMGAGGGALGTVGARALSKGLSAAATITKDTVKTFVGHPSAKGLKVMAKKLDLDIDEIGRRFLEYKAVLGRVPTIAELMDNQSAAELSKMIAERPSAVALAREGSEALLNKRAGDVAEQVKNIDPVKGAGRVQKGKVTSTAEDQLARRDLIADEKFGKLKHEEFEFSNDEFNKLFKGQNRSYTDEANEAIGEAMEAAGEGNPVRLSGEVVEEVRQFYRAKAGNKMQPEKGLKAQRLQHEIEDVASKQNKEYKHALDDFASRSERAKGIDQGRKLVSDDVSIGQAKAANVTDADLGAGMRTGARSKLVDRARESVSSAKRLVNDLVREDGLLARMKGVLPDKEIARLQKVAEIQSRAIANVETITPSVRASMDRTVDQVAKSIIEAGALSTGRAGPGMIAHTVDRIFRLVKPRTSKRVVENIAKDLFDPSRTEEAIKVLRRAGVNNADLLDLLGSSVVGSTVANN
jgi:hypothetical protein